MTTDWLVDVKQVKAELLQLCEDNPANTGRIPVPNLEATQTCVYFLSPTDGVLMPAAVRTKRDLGEPVCIVGAWLNEFHYDWLDGEGLLDDIAINEPAGELHVPITGNARILLSEVQRLQDEGISWGELRDDIVRFFP